MLADRYQRLSTLSPTPRALMSFSITSYRKRRSNRRHLGDDKTCLRRPRSICDKMTELCLIITPHRSSSHPPTWRKLRKIGDTSPSASGGRKDHRWRRCRTKFVGYLVEPIFRWGFCCVSVSPLPLAEFFTLVYHFLGDCAIISVLIVVFQ